MKSVLRAEKLVGGNFYLTTEHQNLFDPVLRI